MGIIKHFKTRSLSSSSQCVFASVSLSVSVCLCVWLCVSFSACICLPACVCLHLSVCLCVSECICLCVCVYIPVSVVLCPSSSGVAQWPRRCSVRGLWESPSPSTSASLWAWWWLSTLLGECQVNNTLQEQIDSGSNCTTRIIKTSLSGVGTFGGQP